MSHYYFMLDELTKLCATTVTKEQAEKALTRLRQLEDTKPTAAELGRGALTGAMIAPVATTASKIVSGDAAKGLTKALARPGVGGKLKGVGGALLGGSRQLAAASAGSAAFASLLPAVRGHLDRGAEKEKLRTYLGTSKRSKLHREITNYTGL